jgi:hypothetical protein
MDVSVFSLRRGDMKNTKMGRYTDKRIFFFPGLLKIWVFCEQNPTGDIDGYKPEAFS